MTEMIGSGFIIVRNEVEAVIDLNKNSSGGLRTRSILA
jgi:hypothetical protein